jgi:hypothetical protein
MALHNPGISAAASLTTPSSGSTAPAKEAATPGRFNQVLAQMAPSTSQTVRVQREDTLIGLVKTQHRQQGIAVSENQAYRLAHQLAADNRIANPNLIQPGQRIDFSRLHGLALAQTPPQSPSALDVPAPARTALEQMRSPARPTIPPAANVPAVTAADHPVLERVLDRAVGKGFIPSAELARVRDKILQLSEKHKFAPDDFARLSLMESGGMNPQASNGHCHGVIQFCDGPARGAAAVGFPSNAKSILGMSLFKQLDLVDQYFSKVGMPAKAEKQGLDDLYLSILSPAARGEARPDAPLSIAGPQASLLHVGRNQRNPITRNSLVAGLQALTETILSAETSRKGPVRSYAEVANPSEPSTDW